MQLYCRPGGAFEHNDQRLERIRINWEWDSGQWVLIASKRDVLWAWQSWYRMTPERLQASKTEARAAFIHGHSARQDLTHGPEALIATTVIAPWAPRGTYRRLFELTCQANADAAHLCKRALRLSCVEIRSHRAAHPARATVSFDQ